jgi:hypothetical protein
VGRHSLFRKLGTLSSLLSKIGLTVKHNPLYGVFYVDAETDAKMPSGSAALPDRLAATLLVVITLAYQEGGWVDLDRVQKFRRKSQRGISTDLRELQSEGYVEIDQEKKRVRLGPRASFEIDYESFFSELGKVDRTES